MAGSAVRHFGDWAFLAYSPLIAAAIALDRHPSVFWDSNAYRYHCFTAPDAATVDAFHAAAIAAGGHDNGAPGLRPIYGPDYYAAFIIDPDGYRIEAYYGPGET